MKSITACLCLMLALSGCRLPNKTTWRADHLAGIPLYVDHHASAPLTPEEAKNIVAMGVDILKNVDSPPTGDVSTDLPLYIDGALGQFTSLGTFVDKHGIVNDCNDLDQLLNVPGVHVVNEIHCCGGIQTTVIGCSGPNRSMVVFSDQKKRWSLAAKGVLWMHEYGHHKGLCHRDTTNVAVMEPGIAEEHTHVNQCESERFTGPVGFCGGGNCFESFPTSDVLEFAHRIFIEGIPYDEGSSFNADSIPRLTEILHKDTPSNLAEEYYLGNAVTLLGMIGDMRAFDTLASFLENGPQEGASTAHGWNLPRTVVPISIGYILARNRDKENTVEYRRIRDFLLKGLDSSAWSDRFKCDDCKAEEQHWHNAQLTNMTVLGIALSGDQQASAALQTAIGTIARLNKREFSEDQTIRLFREAIRVNSLVRSIGLSEYYRESAREQLGTNR